MYVFIYLSWAALVVLCWNKKGDINEIKSVINLRWNLCFNWMCPKTQNLRCCTLHLVIRTVTEVIHRSVNLKGPSHVFHTQLVYLWQQTSKILLYFFSSSLCAFAALYCSSLYFNFFTAPLMGWNWNFRELIALVCTGKCAFPEITYKVAKLLFF